MNLYTLRLEQGETVFRFRALFHLILAHIPLHRICRNEQIRNHIGIVINIAAADIEHPGNLVEGREQDGITSGLRGQTLTQPGDFRQARFPHLVFVQGNDIRTRNGRSILPEAVQRVAGEQDFRRFILKSRIERFL